MTLANIVDGVLIMCCPDRTHFRPIQSASRNLAEAGATVLGVVVNDVEPASMGGAFSMHGSYGYGYHKYYSSYVNRTGADAEQAVRRSAEASATVTDEE
jgi:Mrp family chromosome partitioning ATPase